jgi:hypothetical protein
MDTDDRSRGAHSSVAGGALAPRRSGVRHRICADSGYLRCELFNRQTLEETRTFLDAVVVAATERRLPLVLIHVRNSVPIFTIERYGFSEYLERAFKSKYRIALEGDSVELRIAHQYIATIARMRGVRLRAFASEAAAIAWLRFGDVSSTTDGVTGQWDT